MDVVKTLKILPPWELHQPPSPPLPQLSVPLYITMIFSDPEAVTKTLHFCNGWKFKHFSKHFSSV